MKILIVVATLLLQLVAALPDRVYAQCEPSTSYVSVTSYVAVTSYVPVTRTVTVTQTVSLPSTSLSETPRVSTSTTTSTISLSEASTDIGPASVNTKQTTYSFVVASGLTSWYGPTPSSGISLATITTTIYVLPSTTISVLQTTTVVPVTIEPPPYVSTSYSLVELISTSTITKTRTTTTIVTDTLTLSRTAFTSPGSGWNSTNAVSTASYAPTGTSVEGIPTTITGTVYWSIGTQITSTSLTTLTLTLTRSQTLTNTVVPSTSTITVSGKVSSTPLAETSQLSQVAESSLTSEVSPIVSTASAVSGGLTSSLTIIPASYGGSTFGSGSTEQTSSSSSATSSSSLDLASSSGAPGASVSLAVPESSAPASSSLQTISQASATSGWTDISPPRSSSATAVASSTSSVIGSASSGSVYSITLVASSDSSGSMLGSSMSQYTTFPLSPSSSIPSSPSGPVTILPTQSASATSVGAISMSSTSSSLSQSQPISLSSHSDTSTSDSTSDSYPAQTSNQASASISLSSELSSSAGHFTATVLPLTTGATKTTTGITSASPVPSVCGEHGNFTLNFDDLPSFMPNQTIDITQAPPIFNGYHHLAFSNGYVYAPPPKAPFPPVSPPHLAVFLGNASGNGLNNTPGAMAPVSGFIRPGEFGDGASDSVSAFWFNGYSTWLGCDNPGPEPCTYVVTAYAWNSATSKEEQIDTQNLTTASCPGFQDCHMEQVSFPATFQRLSGLQIQAYKGSDQVMFFMDDVQLGWYNNTCAAGLQRLQSQRSGPVRRSPRPVKL